MENYTPIEPVVFLANTRQYKYDFNLLTVEQAELAFEIAKFKEDQKSNPPETFNQIIKSKAIDWKFLAMSYLVREIKNDKPMPFDRDAAEMHIATDFKQLPINEKSKIEACLTDFFYNTGQSSMIQTCLQGEKKLNVTEILLPMLLRTLGSKENETPGL